MTVGQYIAKCRKNKGMSQEKLAEMLDVSRQTVSKWETGAALPDTYNMIQLGKILGVGVEYFATGGEEAEKVESAPKASQPKSVCDDEEDDEEIKERLDRRKFWGFVLLVCGITAFVRFFNPDIPLETSVWWTKPVVALILAIPCLFGIKLLAEKK